MSDYEQLKKLLQEKEQRIQELQEIIDESQIIYNLYGEVNKSFDLNEIMERTILFLKKNLHISYAAIYCLEEEKLVLKTSPYLIPGLCHELDYQSNADKLENISFHQLLGDWMLTVPVFSRYDLIGIIACRNQAICEQKGCVKEDFWLNVGYVLGSLLEKGILYKKALAASNLKSIFVANLSHEIRTPLTSIIGFSELLCWEKLNEKQLEYVDSLRSSSNHLLSIVDNILDLSRIEAGKIDISFSEFSICELCRDISSIFKRSAEVKNIFFSIENKADCGLIIYADKARLRQVLINLLGNALKFTERGSVTLVIMVKDERIKFIVRDTGIGIPEEKQKLIFDSFTQADASTTKKYGGTGLGLAISQKIVNLLGGNLEVESKPGEGSSFFFALPLVEVKKKSAPELNVCKENISLLLVDDNELNRKIIRYMLEPSDYSLDDACDGEMALDMVAKKKYDMILMDLQMPKKDGYTAIAEIREKGFTMPIIALSAYNGSQEKKKAYDCGCNDYLVKPLNKANLLNRISLFLGLPVKETEVKDDFKALQQEFLTNVKNNIDEVEAAFASQDREKIKFIGHKWKGTGKMFEYPEISEIGLELENLDIRSDLASWSSLKNRLKKYLPV